MFDDKINYGDSHDLEALKTMFQLNREKPTGRVFGQGVCDDDAQTAIRNMRFIKKLYGKERKKHLFQMQFKLCGVKENSVALIANQICQFISGKGFQSCAYLDREECPAELCVCVNSINYRTARQISNTNRLRKEVIDFMKTQYNDLVI